MTSAPARFIVEVDQPPKDQPPKPAAVTWVSLCMPDPNWANLPIRVFTDTGVPVGSDIVWTAPGEPVTLAFDSTSGAKQYKIYLGSNWPALHLDHPQSGVIVESRAGDGKPMMHLTDMLQAWNQSTTVYGRAMVEGIFEGGHRFGPQGNIFEHFQGWFDVPAAGNLQFSIVSNDAAFVLVDGKEVVEWPGLHDTRPGWQGQFHGAVDLTPGTHLLECYYAFVQNDNRYHEMLCCVQVQGGALTDWTMLMPRTAFFRPIGHAHVVDYQVGAGTPGAAGAATAPPFAVDWGIRNQSIVSPATPDIGLILERLTCRPQKKGTVTWTFDDGTTAQGDYVDHLFPRPGLRKVHLSVTDGAKDLGSVDLTVNIHLGWMQLNGYQPQLIPEHLAELVGRDPSTFTASDLVGCVAVFGNFDNADGLLKILPAICAKLKEMNDADLPYIQVAGSFLGQEELLHGAEATQLLKALVDRCSLDKPSPQVMIVGNETRLALAQLTLMTSDQANDVKSLLDGLQAQVMMGDERRAADVLRADLALATGDVDGAKKQYQKLTGDPSGADARSSIRRTALIGQARAFLDRKDYASAAGALADVASQAPIEKLSPDWALTRLRLLQEEGQSGAAYLWATRLLPVITENGRSELLFRLADLGFAQGHDDVAKKALSELLQKHPYSEEAAQAKGKWPGKV